MNNNTEILAVPQPEAYAPPVEFDEVLNPGSLSVKKVVLSANLASFEAGQAVKEPESLSVLVPSSVEIDPSRTQLLPQIYPVPGGGKILAGNVASVKVGSIDSSDNHNYARYHVVKGYYYPNGLEDGLPEGKGGAGYFVIGTYGKEVVDVAELHHNQEVVAGRQCRNGKFQEDGTGVDVPETVSRKALRINLQSIDMGPGAVPADLLTVENVSASHDVAVSGRFASDDHREQFKDVLNARRTTAGMGAASIALRNV